MTTKFAKIAVVRAIEHMWNNVFFFAFLSCSKQMKTVGPYFCASTYIDVSAFGSSSNKILNKIQDFQWNLT